MDEKTKKTVAADLRKTLTEKLLRQEERAEANLLVKGVLAEPEFAKLKLGEGEQDNIAYDIACKLGDARRTKADNA